MYILYKYKLLTSGDTVINTRVWFGLIHIVHMRTSSHKSSLTTGFRTRHDLRGCTSSICGWTTGLSCSTCMMGHGIALSDWSFSMSAGSGASGPAILPLFWISWTWSATSSRLIDRFEHSSLIRRRWLRFLRVTLLLPSTRTVYCLIEGMLSTMTPVCCQRFFPCVYIL